MLRIKIYFVFYMNIISQYKKEYSHENSYDEDDKDMDETQKIQ